MTKVGFPGKEKSPSRMICKDDFGIKRRICMKKNRRSFIEIEIS